jgi:hypothetical protein
MWIFKDSNGLAQGLLKSAGRLGLPLGINNQP